MQLGQMHFSPFSSERHQNFFENFFEDFFQDLFESPAPKNPKKDTNGDRKLIFRLFGCFFLQLKTTQITAAVLQISDSKQALTFFAGHNSDTKRTGQNCGENFRNFFEHFFEDFFDNFLKTLPRKPEKRQKRRPKTFFAIFRPFFSSTFIAFNEKN